MKKFITKSSFLIASFLMAATFAVPSVVLAQDGTTTVDDRAIEQSVESVPERQSVEFEQPQATSGETTTGYQDENGNPVSKEELNKIREDMGKSIFEKYPIPSVLIALAIVGGIAYLILKRKKKA